MTPKEIQPAIDVLRAQYTIDNPATVEDMALAVGIDVNAPYSYGEVLDLAEALALSPYVVRFWQNGERRYYPSKYVPYESERRP